jgi:hypothetical protein
MGQLSKLKQTMTNTANTIIHSKLVMNIMIVICLLNLIGYIMMRRYNAIILGLLAGVIITRFSKNKTVIMMATLCIVNFFITGSIVKEGYRRRRRRRGRANNKRGRRGKRGKRGVKESFTNEGDENEDDYEEDDYEDEEEMNEEEMNDDEEEDEEESDFSETTEMDAFENGTISSKKADKTIDYAATVETAYDDLNNILGGEGIKNLTNDTQNLVSQQKQLSEAMQGMEPLIKNFGPLMNQATKMMKTMGNSGLTKLVKGN